MKGRQLVEVEHSSGLVQPHLPIEQVDQRRSQSHDQNQCGPGAQSLMDQKSLAEVSSSKTSVWNMQNNISYSSVTTPVWQNFPQL